jgi:hypothetical protein
VPFVQIQQIYQFLRKMRVFSAQGVQNTQKCIEEDKNTDILITNTARFWAIRRQRPKIVFLHGSEKVKNY